MAIIRGTPAKDTLDGTADDDRFIGDSGNDEILGNGGYDGIDYRALTVPVTVVFSGGGFGSVAKGALGTDSFSGISFVLATGGADALTGAAEGVSGYATLLRGEGGNDTIDGLGTAQNLADYWDSPAAVAVDLGSGTANDGWGGTDTLVDVVRVRGSAFADTLTGGGADDFFDASGGNDRYDGGGGTNTLLYSGLSGPITVRFTGNNAGTVGKPDGSTDSFVRITAVYGTAGDDILAGTDATGGDDAVRLRGEAGNDTIDGRSNALVVADYADSPAAVTVDLGTGTASDGWGGTDTLVNVRHVRGSDFDDVLKGSAADEVFELGDLGAHQVSGGGGHDTLLFDGTASMTIDLGGAPGLAGRIAKPGGTVDTLVGITAAFGGGGDDAVLGTAGDDVLGGGAGSNVIDGRGGYNTVSYAVYTAGEAAPSQGATVNLQLGTATNPWGGTDTLLHVQAASGTAFADDLTGAALLGARSFLQGNAGDDTLRAPAANTLVTADYSGDPAGITVDLGAGSATDGYGGHDTLVQIRSVRGSAFADRLIGSGGNDLLEGGGGNDVIDGGSGRDTVILDVAQAAASWLRNADGSVTVTSADGVDTLRHVELLQFTDATVAIGQVAARDLFGDGHSALLSQSASGVVAAADVGGNAVVLGTLAAGQSVLGTGDFDGNGHAELLLRNADNMLQYWSLENGAAASSASFGAVAGKTLLGTGDLDGDGRTDLLWQDAAGRIILWEMNGTQLAGGGVIGTQDPARSLLGVADVTGDGHADLLWRGSDGTVTLWSMDGPRIAATATLGKLDGSWTLRGTGNFDGGGQSELLWQNTDGHAVIWKVASGGTVTTTDLGAHGTVVAVGDYDGNGAAEIVWQDFAGHLQVAGLHDGVLGSLTGVPELASGWHLL